MLPVLKPLGVDQRGTGGTSPPQNLERGIVPPDFVMLQNFKHQITVLALQCRKMCFLPLQQDFYNKSRHASPQNSSQFYANAETGNTLSAQKGEKAD